ncbi:MAG: patatin-like phospholipase family protein [Simkania sp.]|nr:patatin-like phospholipase family protein [Simkania sp.]
MKKLLLGIGLLLAVFTLSACHRHTLARGELEPIPSFDPPEAPPKIALVLGGGGSKGLAHVGVIRELEEAGIHPDLIVGCSAGALIGALYADDPDIDRLEELLLNLKRKDLLDFSLFSSRFGVVKGNSLKAFLQENLHAHSFDGLKIPLVVVATDLHTGELLELGAGPLVPALCASSAVPGVFKPVSYLGRFLVDGGAVDPVPVRVAKKYGAQVIIAVDVGERLSDTEIVHFFGIVKRGLEISYRQLSKEAAREADILLQMNFQGFGMFSDEQNLEIYEQGRAKARELLPRIEQIISERVTDYTEDHAPRWLLFK